MRDLLQLDNLLTSEEILLRDSVRQYVDDKVIPRMTELYELGQFPKEMIKEIADLGLLGMTLPSEYGGSDASYLAYGLVCAELERGDTGLRSFMSVQSSLCMYPIYRYGSDEQKKRFLPDMAKANCIACFGLTESDAGSDPNSMKTNAKKVEGGWELSGSKMWITNASIADIAIVWAKTNDGIRGFIVEKDFEGFEQNEIKHKMSLRASITGELVFNKVFIPDANYLPGSDKGLSAPLSCLSQARFGIAWGVIGAATFCYDTALEYTKTRKQFEKPIASFQLIQKSLVDMFSELQKAILMNLQVARLKDENKDQHEMISLIKRNACFQALNIARETRNLLGANGISLEYHVIRHMNNLESVFTYEGTDNVHTLILGRYLTDLDGFA